MMSSRANLSLYEVSLCGTDLKMYCSLSFSLRWSLGRLFRFVNCASHSPLHRHLFISEQYLKTSLCFQSLSDCCSLHMTALVKRQLNYHSNGFCGLGVCESKPGATHTVSVIWPHDIKRIINSNFLATHSPPLKLHA